MDGHPPLDLDRLSARARAPGSGLGLVIVDRRAAAWRAAIAVLTVGVAALLVLCRGPVVGAVRVWIDSATFNHGFLVIPIALYALHERRERWRHLAPQPAWWALLLFLPVAAAYLVGGVASLLELQQFATVGFIEVLILAVLGWRLVWAMLFPLLYLFFLVPSGEWLVPTLQDFTAGFVVRALHLIGVPVYSDGVMLSIPSADFLVAEACAGIRFLIASIAFGCLFADLVYGSPWRKAAFILLSTVVPVLANGLRALGIVLIAHWSDARYAVGVDHIVYGWLFFCLVTALLIAIGWSFRDRRGAPARPAAPNPAATPASLVAAGVAGIVLMAAAPAYAAWLESVPPKVALEALRPPPAPPGWRLVPGAADGWQPVVPGADRVLEATYAADGRRVRLVVAFFTHQRQGAKAVSSLTRIADDEIWQRLSTGSLSVTLDGTPLSVPASRLAAGSARQLALHWYWIGGHWVDGPLRAKLEQLRAVLVEGRRSAAVVALAAPYDQSPATAEQALRDFLAAGPDIGGMLRRAGGGA